MNEDIQKNYSGCRCFDMEGARCGLMTCLRCGAAILLDPGDEFKPIELHEAFHASLPTVPDRAKEGK